MAIKADTMEERKDLATEDGKSLLDLNRQNWQSHMMEQGGTLKVTAPNGKQDNSCLSGIVYLAHFTHAMRTAPFPCLLKAHHFLPVLLGLSSLHPTFPSTRYVSSLFSNLFVIPHPHLILRNTLDKKTVISGSPHTYHTAYNLVSTSWHCVFAAKSHSWCRDVRMVHMPFPSTLTEGSSLTGPPRAGWLLWDQANSGYMETIRPW